MRISHIAIVTIVSILAALAAFALPAAHAADADGEGKAPSVAEADGAAKIPGAPAPQNAERAAKKDERTAEHGGDDLTSCKRDADGMRGPERSRFMTRCLRERK